MSRSTDIIEKLGWVSVHGGQEDAIVVMEKAAHEIDRLWRALSDARDALRNDFEPDNQSASYKRATQALT